MTNKVKDKDAIRPDLESFTVNHSNAKRMVDKGIAAPIKVKIGPWQATSSTIVGPDNIDPKKKLI